MDDRTAALERSLWFASRIGARTDLHLRSLIESFDGTLEFHPIEELMISRGAWEHVSAMGLDPRMVFAHPDLLSNTPATSAYYRNMALLPQKRVAALAASVSNWESSTGAIKVDREKVVAVCSLYNAVVSSIIEGSTNWTLENGYRNMIANIAVGLDGTMRNIIGQDADAVVKGRTLTWLEQHELVAERRNDGNRFVLANGYVMDYGAEPDIGFTIDGKLSASIEIKGGRDPAGALERLGAAMKSFEDTPPGCVNFLVAGVYTTEMRRRLDAIGTVRTFQLDGLSVDGEEWFRFLDELFHHTVRLVDGTVRP